MWEDLIQKAKEGGLDVVETYVFWNIHEPSPGNVLQFLQFLFYFFCEIYWVYVIFACLWVFSTILKGDMT